MNEMPEEFFITRLGRMEGIVARRLPQMETPYGSVVAVTGEDIFSPTDYTIVPGFYARQSPYSRPERPRIEVNPVPEEKQVEVSEILKTQGYKEPFNFWKETPSTWQPF